MAEIVSQLNYHYYSIIDQCKQLNSILESLNEQECEVYCNIYLTNTGLYYIDYQSQYVKIETVEQLTSVLLYSNNLNAYNDDAIVQLQQLHKFSNALKNTISKKQKEVGTDEIAGRPIDVI